VKKIFGAVFVLISVLVLSACGTVVSPEMETATLEVRIVTSESDSTPIEHLIAYNADGEPVASKTSFINREVTLELPRGEYVVEAQISGEIGLVMMNRALTLAGDSETVLDLTEFASSHWMDSDVGIRARFAAYNTMSKFDPSIDLDFVSSVFEMSRAYETTEITTSGLHLVHANSAERLTFVPDNSGIFGGGHYNLYVSLQDEGVGCEFSIGTYHVSWEGDGIVKFQTLSPTWSCKG
jgi:hypothetical protein